VLNENENSYRYYTSKAIEKPRPDTILCSTQMLDTKAAQRLALQLPPRRLAQRFKKGTISRAEGGQLQAPVGPPIEFGTTLHFTPCYRS